MLDLLSSRVTFLRGITTMYYKKKDVYHCTIVSNIGS